MNGTKRSGEKKQDKIMKFTAHKLAIATFFMRNNFVHRLSCHLSARGSHSASLPLCFSMSFLFFHSFTIHFSFYPYLFRLIAHLFFHASFILNIYIIIHSFIYNILNCKKMLVLSIFFTNMLYKILL